MTKNYSKEEIEEASKKAYLDIVKGKFFKTEFREIKIVQNGNSNPFEVIQETLKYKLDIPFLEKNGYLK